MVTKSKKQSKTSSRNNATTKKPPRVPLQRNPRMATGPAPSNLDVLRRMYAAMLKCRMMEERARDGNAMVAYDLTTGHEAVVIGASIDLKPEDTIAASRRNFAAHVAMGTSLKYLLKEDAASTSDDSRASIISCRCVVAGSISSAAFSPIHSIWPPALRCRTSWRRKTNVVVAFWDEDAASLEASHEALEVRRHSQAARSFM